jgi:hypothetical protein
LRIEIADTETGLQGEWQISAGELHPRRPMDMMHIAERELADM